MTAQPLTHDSPRDGESVTLCCGRSPLELPRTDRITTDPTSVTCGVMRHTHDGHCPLCYGSCGGDDA